MAHASRGNVNRDFVLATGETYKVRTFVELAFKEIGVEIMHGQFGYDAKDESRVLVRVDPRYFRPTEVDILIGDPAKAEKNSDGRKTVQAPVFRPSG